MYSNTVCVYQQLTLNLNKDDTVYLMLPRANKPSIMYLLGLISIKGDYSISDAFYSHKFTGSKVNYAVPGATPTPSIQVNY